MSIFRPARPRSTSVHVVLTLAQASVFWLVFVVGAPLAFVWLERRFGIPPFAFAGQHICGAAVMVVMGVLNLWSGLTMAVVGQGTPFPTDTAQHLVVRGPYRFVRSPMALGGLGAGLGVALITGSWLTVAYVVVGGSLWHVIARPLEERDLEERFGAPYVEYRRAVRNWWPRSTPFRGEGG